MITRAVLFDFDFTLADSSGAIIDCVRHASCLCGGTAPAPEQIRPLIGITLPEVHARLGLPGPAAPFVEAFLAHADQIMSARTILFDEALAAVEDLRAAGLRTGIVSTKVRRRLVEVLARENRSHLFDLVYGLEDVPAPKPDPSGLLKAVGALGVPPAAALYIGDHRVDALAARAAGIPFLAVLTGVTPPEDFAALGAECLATLADLPGRLRCAV